MFHRPRQQELVEFLELQLVGVRHPEILRRQPQMICAGLRPSPIRTDLIGINPKLLGQPRNRGPRRRGHVIGHEPQPRQRAQRNGKAQPVCWAATPAPGRRTPCPLGST